MLSSMASQSSAEKVRENRLRRMAERRQLALRKSRRRDPKAFDYGRYWLIDSNTNGLVAGDQTGMSLDEVEHWLAA